ncbi:monovalent cation:proton antiporter-2 (CPA2) family protein [Biformimicrobium ophioploci]|uniref:Glutathione-regulated potassium-efflux system protein KefC n=1 Tax=Biformimicrobium ophioploci TaxID=3036711 RepID=A0ABQ6LVI4_9GAMM|nr:monovalent cation:proton antiporter-2 (CPA2) family protein [Microbulbifer sp. NKW57]GMG86071.1 glutathione-regulated potassium-efflux system protein KefC [Microbulbifer sp. NKW57]
MEHGNILVQISIYLLAAVIAVPIFKRLGLGSVLGYLVAGALIGPHIFGLVGEQEDVMHFAEFGVVMMLFLIGLELQLKKLWDMRGPILVVGSAQVLLTSAVLIAVALAMGLQMREAITVGMVLSLSSTAIVLQTLSEKGLMKTEGGTAAFSVLLYQDIAVIPMLALLPLLAPYEIRTGEGLSGWQQTLVVVVSLVGILLAGRYLLGRLLRRVAGSRLRELFIATALLIVVGIAALMNAIGISPALGAFIAGVALAECEYRHQLEADIEPFKGLLLGLFFITVGASIDFGLIASEPMLIFGLVAMLAVVKFAILFGLSKVAGMSPGENYLFSFSLAQAGEFGFVLLAFAGRHEIVSEDLKGILVAVVALSMATTPLLMLVHEKLVQPRFLRGESDREADEIPDTDTPVIIVGYGRFGQITGRLLNLCGFETTLLERNAEQLDLVRRYGIRAFYGDASRPELLKAAGADKAKLLVLTLNNQAESLAIVDQVRTHFPHLKILARARNRMHQYALMEAGVTHVFRETVDSALAIGECALRLLGWRASRARRAALEFKAYDQRMLEQLFPYWKDESQHIEKTKAYREQLLQALQEDRREVDLHLDGHWESGQGSKPGL